MRYLLRCSRSSSSLLASGASAEEYGRPSAVLVNPIKDQTVHGDDGMDHVKIRTLLVVSVFLSR